MRLQKVAENIKKYKLWFIDKDKPDIDKPESDKVDNNNNKPTISRTSANTTTNNKNKNTNGKVKTGDNSHMALYTVSLLLSLMVVAGCIIMSRKRRNR